MALETRHTEKNLLFMLLELQNSDKKFKESKKLKKIIAQLKATMEPEDVKLVQKEIMELAKN